MIFTLSLGSFIDKYVVFNLSQSVNGLKSCLKNNRAKILNNIIGCLLLILQVIMRISLFTPASFVQKLFCEIFRNPASRKNSMSCSQLIRLVQPRTCGGILCSNVLLMGKVLGRIYPDIAFPQYSH